MHSKALVGLASLAALAPSVAALNATVVTNNPRDVTYVATLPLKPFFSEAAITGNVLGSIVATAGDDGVGTRFTVVFSNLPKNGGPFIYHIHAHPVVDGNCTTALAHLDPQDRGEKPPCESYLGETCQVGDLSGKHGKILSDPFQVEYTDLYTSLQPGSPAYFGNLSFVLHYANTTRLTCANFHKIESPNGDCSAAPSQEIPSAATNSSGTAATTATTSTAVPTVPSTVPVTAGAARKAMGAPLFALGAAVMMI